MTFEEELRDAMNTYKPIPINDFIFKEIVEKYYVDKQRFKDIIGKRKMKVQKEIDNFGDRISDGEMNMLEWIKKELGL